MAQNENTQVNQEKSGIIGFLSGVKSELKKVVWPTPKNVFKNVGVVLATIILLGLFIFLLDTVFMNLLGLVMQVAK